MSSREEPYLEAVFKLLADKVEDDGVDAGVDGREVDAQIIQHQQETERRGTDRLSQHGLFGCFLWNRYGTMICVSIM